MDPEKLAHIKSPESSLTDRPVKPKKHRDKPGNKKLRLRPTEDSENPKCEESAEGVNRDFNAADIGGAGEWPVEVKNVPADTKNDSAGPPVRSEPEPKPEKKKSKKSKKKAKIKETKGEVKDQPDDDKMKKLLQPSSSDNNQPSEKVTDECTTKRNLHLIKTERSDKEEKKESKKKEKKKSTKKQKKSDEKIGGGGKVEDSKNPNRRKVDLLSIKVDKKQPLQPKVERDCIKPEGWQDVERDSLDNINPQYENLPEDTLMKQLRTPPPDPNTNPFTPRAGTPVSQQPRTPASSKEPTTEKKTTERERGQLTVGQERSMEVSEMPKSSMKRNFKTLPRFIIVILAVLIVSCLILAFTLIGVSISYNADVAKLEKRIDELTAALPAQDRA